MKIYTLQYKNKWKYTNKLCFNFKWRGEGHQLYYWKSDSHFIFQTFFVVVWNALHNVTRARLEKFVKRVIRIKKLNRSSGFNPCFGFQRNISISLYELKRVLNWAFKLGFIFFRFTDFLGITFTQFLTFFFFSLSTLFKCSCNFLHELYFKLFFPIFSLLFFFTIVFLDIELLLTVFYIYFLGQLPQIIVATKHPWKQQSKS